jgi:hypothetical protein
MAAHASAAESEPLNESGARTIFMPVSYQPKAEKSSVGHADFAV